MLGTLKAAGLALGLAGVPVIGITAAGLVLFFVGGVGVNLRAHEHRHIFATLGYHALANASLLVATPGVVPVVTAIR